MNPVFDQNNYAMYSDAPHALGGGALHVKPMGFQGGNYKTGSNYANPAKTQTEAIDYDPKVDFYDRQILQLQEELNENQVKIENHKKAIPALQRKYAPKAMADDVIEEKLAANRARRIKKDDESLKQYRWKKEQDMKNRQLEMNYRWQNGITESENELGKITSRNEFNEKLNTATRNWLEARRSGDVVAEAHAKQTLDGVLAFGREQYKIDGSAEIQKAVELEEQNKQRAQRQQQQAAQFMKEKPAVFATSNDIAAWNGKVFNAYQTGEISFDHYKELVEKGDSTEGKKGKKRESDDLDIGSGDRKAKAAAERLTLNELFGKTSLNKWEEAALDSKYPVANRQADAAAYNALATATERKDWAKRNPGKLEYLKKKGLIK